MSDFVDRFECLRLISDSVKVNGKEKAILLFIFRYSDSKTGYKWSYPSRERLKELYGTKRDETLDNILNTLYEKGVLVKRTGKRNRNEYSIIYDNLKNIDTPKSVNTKNVDTLENVGIVPPENVGIVPPKNGVQKENKKKIKENIYSDLDNEDYVNKINEELEEDLFNRIKSNYDPGEIKKELDNLKDKGLSKLDLLKELENNLKIKAIETKKEEPKDVEDIFNYWNSKKIIKHKEITSVIKKEVMKVLKKYSAEEIKQAIDLYSEILKSEFYFSYKWSLSDFLKRNNGISTFMEEGSNKANYEEWKSKNKSKNDTDMDFDDEKYII